MRCWILLGALLVASGCGRTDCDPEAAEICNNVDDNCNGQIDEGLATQTYYADGDGDGHGTSMASTAACMLPAGYAGNDDDCDDTNAAISPAAAEVCELSGEPIDNDCDGLIDDEDGSLSDGVIGYLDADGDGYGGAPGFAFCSLPSGFIEQDGDCDDFDASITLARVWYVDSDGDGYGDEDATLESCEAPDAGYVSNADDCDDTDAEISPIAEEVCEDGVDNNCDGSGGDCALLYGDVGIDQASVSIDGRSSTFGRNISSADFDQDGTMELVTADTNGYIGSGTEQGAIYVFSDLEDGDELATSDALLTLYGSSNDPIGLQTVATDDLTGDGIPDIASMFTSGAIVIHPGDASGVKDIYSALIAIEDTNGDDVFAGQMGAADFSGDGRADLLVGSPELTETQYYEGRAHLIPGPLTDDVSVSDDVVVIYSESDYAGMFGYQVASAGDTNGDGSLEAMISARGSSISGTAYSGAVYVFEGSALTSSVSAADADAAVYGTINNGYLGHDISGASDVNDDGYDDVFINAGNTDGGAYVFFGPLDEISTDEAADSQIYTDEDSSYLGFRLTMAGDINDDGVDDIAFSELMSDYSVTSGGAVGLALGPLSGSYSLQTADAVIFPDSSIFLGHDLHGVGDVNGDGVDDLAVSAYYGSTLWLFFGGSGI